MTFCKRFAIVSPRVNADSPYKGRGAARLAAGLVLLLLFLAMEAVALFPCLHHAVHSESDNANHVCAVTLLESGRVQAGGGGCEPLPTPEPVVVLVRSNESSPFVPSPILPGVPERGPPCAGVIPSVAA